MASNVPDIDYGLTIGPLLIGVVFNAFVFGICVMQLITYSTSGFKDSWWILGVLGWMYIIDAFQVCTSVTMLWHYIVVKFSDPAALASAPWEYATLPIFSSIAPVPVQQFMAYRIMRFSKSRMLFLLVSALSLGQASFACVAAAQGLTRTTIENNVAIVPITAAWIVFSIACDTSISTLLLYYLLKSRTGFERTDSIVMKICSTIVKAAVPVTVLCTTDLFLLITMPDNNLHYMFALPVGRLYTCTLLNTLNGRKRLREQIQNTTSGQQRIGLSPVVAWRNRLECHQSQSEVRVDIDMENGSAYDDSLDLDSMRDALRSMKAKVDADDEGDSIPEMSLNQGMMVSRL